MKKFTLIVASLVFWVSVGFPAYLVARGSASDSGMPKIGVIQNYVGSDVYQTTYDKALREEAEKYPEIDAIIADAGGDVVRQVGQMNDLITQKVDVIVLWPANAQALIPAVKKAHDAGIPVVITNSKIGKGGEQYITAFSGPDDELQGRYTAQLLAEAIGEQGDVVQIMGLPGYSAAEDRRRGFEEELAKYPGITLLDTQPGDWQPEKAQRVMENFLTKFPSIDGVAAANDGMGIGALNAAKAAGRADEIKFVGTTNYGIGYDAIKKGEYYGSIQQSPVIDAQNAFAIALRIVKGENVPKWNFFDTPKITAKNIDQFPRPVF